MLFFQGPCFLVDLGNAINKLSDACWQDEALSELSMVKPSITQQMPPRRVLPTLPMRDPPAAPL